MKRNSYLTISILCFVIATIAFLCISCAPSWRGACGPDALYCSTVVGEYHPTRIVVGKLGEGYHAIAQGYFKGEWRDLRRKGDYVFMESKNCIMKEGVYYTTVPFTARWFSGRVIVKPE